MLKIILYPFFFVCFMLPSLVHAQGELLITNGASITESGSGLITLHNCKLTNNGSYTSDDGTIQFTGNATNAQSSINGDEPIFLNNLTIDKTANGVQLNQNIDVKGYLTLTSGALQMTAGNIDLGNTGLIIDETATNRIYDTGGYIKSTVALNAPTNVNVGNMGAEITSAANLGSTEVRRYHNVITQTGSSIARSYDIHPTNNTGLNATLRFRYLESELNGNNENTMVLWRSTDNGVTWSAQTISARNTTDNWVEVTALSGFSNWTASSQSILPVTLVYFKGKAKGNNDVLNWVTASEQNSLGFEIERSADGINFTKIGFVHSQGNGKTQQRYEFVHQPEGLGKNAYYRLLQLDNDHTATLSNVVLIQRETNNDVLKVYPNPVVDILSIQTTYNNTDFSILNALGQIVLKGSTDMQNIDISMLTKGNYLLKVADKQVQFIKPE